MKRSPGRRWSGDPAGPKCAPPPAAISTVPRRSPQRRGFFSSAARAASRAIRRPGSRTRSGILNPLTRGNAHGRGLDSQLRLFVLLEQCHGVTDGYEPRATIPPDSEQCPIAGDDRLGAGREGGADHDIVVGIGCDAWNRYRSHQSGQHHVAIDELIDGQLRGGDLPLELGSAEDIGQFSQQRCAGEKIDTSIARGLQQS